MELKHELPTREPSRDGRRKIFSPLSIQTPCASFNHLENSFERFSSSCRISVTIFILFIQHIATAGRLANLDRWTNRFFQPFVHPSVTDPVEPDPVDYFPLPSGNLVSPVSSEYSDFTRLFLCFLSDCVV